MAADSCSNPLSEGPMALPFQRPQELCRTFDSEHVEDTILYMNKHMKDKDLARIFENAFPNTLDTTVRWHMDGSEELVVSDDVDPGAWQGPQSFIVTGDIEAEWLRDSTNQLAQYQRLVKKDKALNNLILGAINTQAEYVIESPYCNAFQPPPPSGIAPSGAGARDDVHPAYEPARVFECKYELDSLAAFLSLSNQFYNHSGSTAFLTPRWYSALRSLLTTLDDQSRPAFNVKTGLFEPNAYTFKRNTNTGTETLPLNGNGNPLGAGTGLIRSTFRPSDDATILGFLIPANAMMSVELRRASKLIASAGKSAIAKDLLSRADAISAGIWKYGVHEHPVYGKVFAYETDGYGSHIFMDDANLPSLLALPLMGFVEADDPVYVNTRKMILSQQGNPYYLTGRAFAGIGGPHVGLSNAWPIARLVQAMTSDDDEEIKGCLAAVKKVCPLGLVHESVNVVRAREYTREFGRVWAVMRY